MGHSSFIKRLPTRFARLLPDGRSKGLVLVLVATITLVGTTATAAVRNSGSLRARGDVDPKEAIRYDQARSLSHIGGPKSGFGLWEAPTVNGWTCGVVQIGPAVANAPTGNGGALCARGTQKIPLELAIAWVPVAAGGYNALITGRVRPDVSSVVLNIGGKTTPLTIGDGFFIGQFSAQQDNAIPSDGLSYSVTAADANGNVLSTLDLREIVARSTP
jgi:hypothetical protein